MREEHQSIEMRIINLFKVKDGRVVEQWAEPDLFGLLQSHTLGVELLFSDLPGRTSGRTS